VVKGTDYVGSYNNHDHDSPLYYEIEVVY